MIDFIIITSLIFIVRRWLQTEPFYWKKADIPYSIPLPVVGSMGPALYTPLKYTFQQMYKKVGDNKMYGFHFFERPALLITDPELMKTVAVSESDSFLDRGLHTEESYDPMAKSIFFAKGEQWRVARSKMTPFFTPSRMKNIVPLIQPIAKKFTEHLISQGKTGPVNVHDVSMKMVVDVITCTIFGLKPDAFDRKDSFFFSLQKELISFSFTLKAFLGLLWPSLYRLMGLTVLYKVTTKTITQFVNDVANQRLKGVGVRMDFLQGMVELMQKEKEKADYGHKVELNEDGTIPARFDRYSITGHCMMMYTAGTETTGNVLAFLLYELAMNPEIQEAAREEVLSMIKRTNNQYDFDDLNRLHYVSMVLKEVLRKYPVVAVFSRNCTRTCKLNGTVVPAGTLVFIAPICTQYDERYFSEPEKFMPERFKEDTVISGSYAPFGMGPRVCIGMKLAELEMTLALCNLLPKCRISVSSRTETPIRYSLNPIMSPANGIWLNVQEI